MTLSHQASYVVTHTAQKKNSTILVVQYLRMVCGSVVKREHQWSQNSYLRLLL